MDAGSGRKLIETDVNEDKIGGSFEDWKKEKFRDTWEYECQEKQVANVGRRSIDNHGEMDSLHGNNISINLFQKLMTESVTEKHLH